MEIKIGQLIDDRYRVVARIGHGGMAEVYEANDIVNKITVAIKLIREDVAQNPMNIKRFENEASLAACLSHPNIVKVYYHGHVDDRPYIANEYIKGQNLSDSLDFRGFLPVSEAVDYMIQLTSALYYMHQHNIVHRDIKPANIYLMPDGTIKIGDFGIAQENGQDDGLTQANEIVGSVNYLAPEISRGSMASPSSDIYAAGVTFFELITGHCPFEKEKAVNVAVAHIKEKFPSPTKYIPTCPKEVERIIFKATKKNPKERYKTAKEFYNDLVALKENPKVLREKKNFFARIFGFK